MTNLRGTQAFVARATYRMGWDIFLRKYDSGKVYRPVINTLQWELTSEFEVCEPLTVGEIHNHDSMDSESKLAGENQSLKDEVKYLRQEISKLLDRK